MEPTASSGLACRGGTFIRKNGLKLTFNNSIIQFLMDRSNKLPPFDIAFAGLYASSKEPVPKEGTNEQQPTYQGLSVQRLDTPFPVYHSQSDINQNGADPVNLLIEYNIDSLIPDDLEECFGTDILDKYVPFSSGNDFENGTQSSMPPIPFIQQLCFPGSEPEIIQPASVGHSNTGQLTNLPDVPSNPQDSQPATVVNPLNLNPTASDKQTPQATEIADGNFSIVESQGERYHNDSAFAERKRIYNRDRMRKLRKDPAYVKRERERYRNNPAYTEQQLRCSERRKERCHNDPAYAERERVRSREKIRKLSADPAYLERARMRSRDWHRMRYHNDPAFAERKRMHARERWRRLREDPA